MTHFRHTDIDAAPDEAAIERQIRWERSSIDAGIERYRREQADAPTMADTSAGRRLIQGAMVPFVDHVRAVQESLRTQLTTSTGKPREWWSYFGMLPADKLAFITLNSALSHGERTFLKGKVPALKISAFARIFIRNFEAQVSFEKWVHEERQKTKEAKDHEEPYRNQFEAMKRCTKKVDNRAYKRWMQRLERAWKQPWPETERIAFGSAMARHIADHCGGLFEIGLVPVSGGKTELYLQLTPKAVELLQDHDARAEVARPAQRPMLCRPKPWIYVEAA